MPQYYATTAYKQWARKRMKALGLTLDGFAQAIVRVDPAANATSGGLSQFFGKEGEIPEPSNTTLMPAMNQVLGIAPPPVCNPDDEWSQIFDRLAARFSSMTPHERDLLRAWAGMPPREVAEISGH